MKRIKLAGFLVALSLSAAAWALPAGWSNVGCWSPYPNCVGAKDVLRDPTGAQWECRACGTTTSTSQCFKVGNLNNIGYWCS